MSHIKEVEVLDDEELAVSRAFLLTWNQCVLAIELKNKILYEDWLALWETYNLVSPKLTAWGH